MIVGGLARGCFDEYVVRVYVNDPSRLEELRASLLEARCISVPVADDALDVAHPSALDAREALIELRFFLKAWQDARPGARIELVFRSLSGYTVS